MFVSAKVEYACVAMLELADQHARTTPIRLTEIAEKHGIPQRFLVQILLQLKGAGLVSTTRGASGGYQLSRRPDQINLNEILNAVDPPESSDDRSTGPSPLTRPLQSVWKKLAAVREKILKETTLADLLPRDSGADYMI